MKDVASVRLINRWMLLRRCTTGVKEVGEDGHAYFRKGGILLTQQRGEYNKWFEVYALAPDCRYYEKAHIGGFVTIPNHAPKVSHRVSDEFVVVNERIFDEERHDAPLMVMLEDSTEG